MPIFATKTNVKVDFTVYDSKSSSTSTQPVEIETELKHEDFVRAFKDIEAKKSELSIAGKEESKASFKVEFLVVNDNGTIVSTFPIETQAELNEDGFKKACDDLLNAQANLSSNSDDVQMLVRTGNVLTLGDVRAVSLGIQSQYQLPTTVGTPGQVIAYQGTTNLQFVTPSGSGAQGYQGNQGYQGVQGGQGYQGQAIVGGLTLPYKFDTSTTSFPASGYMRFDANSSFGAVTVIRFNNNDQNSVDESSVLVTGVPLNSLVGIYSTDNYLGKYAIYEITSSGLQNYPTPMGYGVAYRSSYGSLFSANENVQIALSIRGLQGNQGFQGNTGLQGNQGPQGTGGFDGAQGTIGLQGYQGYGGYEGARGLQGAQTICP